MTVAGDVTVIATLSIQNGANAPITRAGDACDGWINTTDHTSRDALPTSVTTLGTLVRTLNDGVVWEVVSVGPVVYLQWTGGGSGGGGGAILAEVYSPSLSTVIAATDLYPSSILPAGMYVVKAYLTIKTAGSAGALVVNAHFTDDSGTAQVIPLTAPIPITTIGVAGYGSAPIQLTGSVTVKYSVAASPGTFTAGPLVYSLRLVLELDRFSPIPSIPGTVVSSFNGRTGVVTSQAGDYSPSQLSQQSAATGQALIWSGSTWAPSTNFGAQNLVTTGALSLGPIPASVGQLRLATGASGILSRNNGNAADLNVYSSDASDNQTFGASNSATTTLQGGTLTQVSGPTVQIVISGTSRLKVDSASVTLGYNLLQFANGLSTPTFNQQAISTAAATGQLLTIGAQDSTGTGATVGGALLLRSGTGAIAGSVELRSGTLRLIDYGLTTAGTLTIGGTGAVTVTLDHTSGGLGFAQGGTGYAQMTSAVLALPTNYVIRFVNGGTVSCSTSGISGFTGGPLNLIATDCTGTGATVGGGVLIRSGTGATSGTVQLLAGTTLSILDYAVTLAANITLGNSNCSVIVNSGTVGTFFEISGSQIAALTSTTLHFSNTFTTVTFDNAVTLLITASSTVSATGALLSIIGQDESGASTIGGKVLIRSGLGATANGDLEMRIGPTTQVFLASVNTTSISGPTTLLLEVGNSTVFKFDSAITVNLPTMQWAVSRIPVINNVASSAASATGNLFTFSAQDCTGTTSVGGSMNIIVGAGTTNGGTGALKSGGTTPGGGAARFTWNDSGLGFYTTSPIAKPTVTGSRASNAALASLLTSLSSLGLLTDSST